MTFLCQENCHVLRSIKECLMQNLPYTLTLQMAFVGAFPKLRKENMSSAISIRPHGTTLTALGGFSWNSIWVFFENFSRKYKLNENLTGITGTLHEDFSTFLITSRSFLLRMKNVSRWRENQNTFYVQHYFLPKIVPFVR